MPAPGVLGTTAGVLTVALAVVATLLNGLALQAQWGRIIGARALLQAWR